MNITIKLKPYDIRIVKGHKPDHHQVTRNITSYTYKATGNGYVNQSGDFIGFVFEKHNRKVKKFKKIVKEHNGVKVKTTVRTYEPAYWKVSVYIIPTTLLRAIGMEFKQKNRHFTITPKKYSTYQI